MAERRYEWTDPHPDHGGITQWIDEDGEWCSSSPAGAPEIPEYEKDLSDIAYVKHLAGLLDGLVEAVKEQIYRRELASLAQLPGLGRYHSEARSDAARLRAALARCEGEKS